MLHSVQVDSFSYSGFLDQLSLDNKDLQKRY